MRVAGLHRGVLRFLCPRWLSSPQLAAASAAAAAWDPGEMSPVLSFRTGWWFGTMEFDDFPYIGNFIIPTDFHIFQRG